MNLIGAVTFFRYEIGPVIPPSTQLPSQLAPSSLVAECWFGNEPAGNWHVRTAVLFQPAPFGSGRQGRRLSRPVNPRWNGENWAGAVRQLSYSIAVRRLSGNLVGSELPERHDVVESRRKVVSRRTFPLGRAARKSRERISCKSDLMRARTRDRR